MRWNRWLCSWQSWWRRRWQPCQLFRSAGPRQVLSSVPSHSRHRTSHRPQYKGQRWNPCPLQVSLTGRCSTRSSTSWGLLVALVGKNNDGESVQFGVHISCWCVRNCDIDILANMQNFWQWPLISGYQTLVIYWNLFRSYQTVCYRLLDQRSQLKELTRLTNYNINVNTFWQLLQFRFLCQTFFANSINQYSNYFSNLAQITALSPPKKNMWSDIFSRSWNTGYGNKNPFALLNSCIVQNLPAPISCLPLAICWKK